MKRYLLTIGYDYYPRRGNRNWIGIYDTESEAQDQLEIERKQHIKEDGESIATCMWYSIIDLENWEGSEVFDLSKNEQY